MEFIAEIRRRHLVNGESVSSIARSLQLSRPTVRKAIKASAEPVYRRQSQPAPKLGGFLVQLEQWLDVESRLPRRQRRTAKRLFEGLQAEGYRGSYGRGHESMADAGPRMGAQGKGSAVAWPCQPPALFRVLRSRMPKVL